MRHFLLSKVFPINMTDDRRQVCGAKNGGEKESKHEVTRSDTNTTIISSYMDMQKFYNDNRK